jgi:hypothetical protein
MKKQAEGWRLEEADRLRKIKEAANKAKTTNKSGRSTRPGKKPATAPPKAQQPYSMNMFGQGGTQSFANSKSKSPHSSTHTSGAQTPPTKKSPAEIAAENKAMAEQQLKEWETEGIKKNKKVGFGERAW